MARRGERALASGRVRSGARGRGMSERRPKGVTRRELVGGMGAAAFSGVIAGGAAGFFGGRRDESAASTEQTGKPLTIGVLAPVTGAAAADGQEMVRGIKLGV